jgi:hypothetical protein
MKAPPHAEDVAEQLRERAKRGDLKFSKAELNRIASILDKLSYRCAGRRRLSNARPAVFPVY